MQTTITTIITRNGWIIKGIITSKSALQLVVRVTEVSHRGVDCTMLVGPNMIIEPGNVHEIIEGSH